MSRALELSPLGWRLQLLNEMRQFVHALGLFDLLEHVIQLMYVVSLALLDLGVLELVEHLFLEIAHFLDLSISILNDTDVLLHQFLLAGRL